MEAPRINGLKVTQTIGSGVSGIVYAAEDERGKKVAAKVFNDRSVQLFLLQKMTQRLETGGWPRGVMPVLSADYEARPARRVTLDYRDDSGKPSSLQHRWGSDPSIVPWDLIRELAQALASMHGRQVAHGNLKPGNIFFAESGELLLSDWALGQMPGVSQLGYTDAFLYQSPEQLLYPEGYLEEAGYRWDVYAFASLSFRLLTGQFPRCEKTFSKVAPPFGDTKHESIEADTQKMARSLMTEELIRWPESDVDNREQQYRDLILQCLHLAPNERPSSMIEVSRAFDEIDFRYDAEQQSDKLLNQSRRSRRIVTLLTFISCVLLAAVVIATVNWMRTKDLLDKEKSHSLAERDGLSKSKKEELDGLSKTKQEELDGLSKTTQEALHQKTIVEEQLKKEVTLAQAEKQKAEQALINDRAQWIEKLRASRQIGDNLFTWALSKEHRNLPPLDGRETRLQSLEAYYQQFINEASLLPELSEEKARAKWQLAEISLAKGQADLAAKQLEISLPDIQKYDHDASWSVRIATGELLLALLWQSSGDERSDAAFKDARTAIAALPKSAVDLDRIKQLTAILEYHEAANIAKKGEAEKALEQLMRATTLLNEIADVRPEVTVLRSELADCYLNSATILEGMGQMGDARETRVLAVNELLAQLKAKPKDFAIRLSLASTYGAMAETSMLAGDVTSADQLSQNSIKFLEQLLREQPENIQATIRLASQRIIVASLLEDRGETIKAREAVDKGIKLLENIIAAEKPDPLATFHYGRLLWEKGRILSASNQRKPAFALYQQALLLLEPMCEKDHGVLRAEHIMRHLGYLHSDMGHAAQLDKNIDQAKRSFAASISIWKELLKLQPQNEEYQELLQWSQGRLKEL
jgi:serine/threonine protein kinase/tetratricopeptide (TPR) repeat protein